MASGQFSNRLIGLAVGDELMVHLEQGRRGRALVNVCSRSEQQLGVNVGTTLRRKRTAAAICAATPLVVGFLTT